MNLAVDTTAEPDVLGKFRVAKSGDTKAMTLDMAYMQHVADAQVGITPIAVRPSLAAEIGSRALDPAGFSSQHLATG